MKKWMWIVILGALGIGALLFPVFVSNEVENAFDVFNTKLDQAFLVSDSLLQIKQKEFVKRIQINESLDIDLKTQLTNLNSITYESYKSLIQELDAHITFLTLSKELFEKKNGTNSTTTTYWFGPQTETMEKRGKGKARVLRDEIENFRLSLIDVNKKLANEFKRDTFYQPSLLSQGKNEGQMISWEKETFEGPIFSNLATLQKLKLDEAEIYHNQLDFFNELLSI